MSNDSKCTVFAFAPVAYQVGVSGDTCPRVKAYQHFIQPFKNARFRQTYA